MATAPSVSTAGSVGTQAARSAGTARDNSQAPVPTARSPATACAPQSSHVARGMRVVSRHSKRAPSVAPSQPTASAVRGASARRAGRSSIPIPGPSTSPRRTSGTPVARTASTPCGGARRSQDKRVAASPAIASSASAATGFTRERSRVLDAGASRAVASRIPWHRRSASPAGARSRGRYGPPATRTPPSPSSPRLSSPTAPAAWTTCRASAMSKRCWRCSRISAP